MFPFVYWCKYQVESFVKKVNVCKINYCEKLPLLLQVTPLLLILSVFKVNGISFRHDVSGYDISDGSIASSSFFEPIPMQHPTDSSYGPLTNSIDPLEAYISGKDGRLLKQYEVFEDHGEGDILNELRHPQKSFPQFFYPTAHISSEFLYPDSPFPYPGLKGLDYDSFAANPVKSTLSNNHGPIALGMLPSSILLIQLPLLYFFFA